MGNMCNNQSLKRESQRHEGSLLLTYRYAEGVFTYPDGIDDVLAGRYDTRPLWQVWKEDKVTSEEEALRLHKSCEAIACARVLQAQFEDYHVTDATGERRWFRVGLICPTSDAVVAITLTDIDDEVIGRCNIPHKAEHDELTELMSKDAFDRAVEAKMTADEEGVAAGEYALVYFDVLRFKAINDLFGMAEGDRLLLHIADAIREALKEGDTACRIGSDRFVFFTHTSGEELEVLLEKLLKTITKFDLPFEITCNAGVYVTGGSPLLVDSMIDRAVLAQSQIKGSYTQHCNFYTESLRNDMLGEQEIVGMMATALAEKHFVVYYQPQYNHTTGMLVGAEALVRWNHPEKGLISPGIFIPIFEKNGFITKLDLYVFEHVCEFLRRCMDSGVHMVPISTNFSRHDIFQKHFVESLEEIRGRYEVPSKFLRVEITESVIVGGSQHVSEVVRRLHECGYVVEMDDFGSGYSSLNVLKDIELDVIKLDMLFLAQETDSNRGGTILSSVVRMAKWLGMPVIAEGVEHVGQADFLRSIGCDYIQGYLYSRPLPEAKYEELISGSTIGATVPQMNLIDTLNACDFWNPQSLETLIFSNYVGGAAIFDYHDGKVEVLRVNQKYLQELCMNLTERDIIEGDPMRFFDDTNRLIYTDMLERAITTGEEQECETWRTISSPCCGDERICVRTNARMIGKSGESHLFYAMIRNITAEKNRFTDILDSERRFKVVSEQVNVYFWEYTIATREMRPCFRCMRDLGFPPLLTNYPDSAIERGVFPPDYADMYRDWHRQIAEGVKELEAVIPLTVGRVPFHVRYTTEFDENGNPVKAYGSATLVV